MTRRALVTGGAGFVGANLARRLLRDGHEVHLLVRPGDSGWRIDGIRPDVRLHEASLLDASALAEALRQVRPDWIFHLAAYGAYSWQMDLERMVATNYLGTLGLVEAALRQGFDALVSAGSSSEYGFQDHPPAESELPAPNSHYAATKAAATLHLGCVARRERAPITTLRLYTVYGPFEDPRRLIPTLIARGLEGRLPPLADAATARDFVYAADVCEAFVRAAAAAPTDPGAVYNVGTGTQSTLAQVVDLARRELDVPESPRWGSHAPRAWDTATWVARIDAIRSALQWQPRYALAEGFREMVAWMRADPALRDRYRRIEERSEADAAT